MGVFPLAKVGEIPHTMVPMEQLIIDLSAYADATGRSPQAVLRSAINAKWGTWDAWCAGRSSPTLSSVDRVRRYMAAHPPLREEAA